MRKISIGSAVFIFIWLLMALVLEANEVRYKLYCFYTPQYRELYEEYFLPSLQDNFDVVAKVCEQECPSSLFKSTGWEITMFRKLQMVREAILQHWDGKIFFYSDIDIIFLRPILNAALLHLKDCDFAIQQSWPYRKICAGFFIMRGNEKTLNLIDKAIELMENKICLDDQTALRIALKNISEEELSWKFLPSSKFPNGRRVLKDYQKKTNLIYQKGMEIDIDDSILLFHANCSIGLENKMHFLARVQEEYTKKMQKR